MHAWAIYYTRKIQPVYANHTGAAAASIFRRENKLLDASCRSSCRSTTREVGKKTWGVPRERTSVTSRSVTPSAITDTFHLLPSAYLLTYKNPAYFFLIEIITRNTRGFIIAVYNLCRVPDRERRFPFLRPSVRYFCPSVANATLRLQTPTAGVKSISKN